MNRRKYLNLIPNLFTFANLLLGLMSILLLVQTEHPNKTFIVSALILLGGAADFFDGYFARRLNAVTDFGKQMDSFADIITFGIAPVGLMNYLFTCNHKIPILAASALYLAAGAYRLARFNLGDFKDHFVGLPIPVAGILLTFYSVAYPAWSANVHSIVCTAITIVVIVLLAMLMVSRQKIKRIRLKKKI